jgi:hypothetical protein
MFILGDTIDSVTSLAYSPRRAAAEQQAGKAERRNGYRVGEQANYVSPRGNGPLPAAVNRLQIYNTNRTIIGLYANHYSRGRRQGDIIDGGVVVKRKSHSRLPGYGSQPNAGLGRDKRTGGFGKLTAGGQAQNHYYHCQLFHFFSP